MANITAQIPPQALSSRTVRFTKKKETPGCKVFQEQEIEGQPIVIGTLYVKNWFAGSATSVTVTISKE